MLTIRYPDLVDLVTGLSFRQGLRQGPVSDRGDGDGVHESVIRSMRHHAGDTPCMGETWGRPRAAGGNLPRKASASPVSVRADHDEAVPRLVLFAHGKGDDSAMNRQHQESAW